MARTREQRKLGQQFWIVGECRCLSLLLRYCFTRALRFEKLVRGNPIHRRP